MKMHSWPTTRFRRVTGAATIALASLAAVSCDDDPAGPGGAITNVEIEATPSGTSTTNLPRNATVQLIAAPENANGFFTPATVTWASTNTAVATVDANGLVTTVAGGETYITAAAGGAMDSLLVSVQFPVQTLTVESDTLEIRQEGTANLTVTLIDTEGDTVTARNVTFITLDEDIAMVDDAGVVTGVADGTATIEITSEGVTETIDIVVSGSPLVATVTVTPASPFRGVGQTVQMTHTSRSAAGNTVAGTTATWSSGNTAVATVDPVTGLVTVVGVGTADIRATVDDGDGTDVTGSTTLRGATQLVNGVTQSVPTTTAGQNYYYAFVNSVPVTTFTVTTTGGTGDGDIYIYNPSGTLVCQSFNSGNDELCTINNAVSGTYTVLMNAWSGAPPNTAGMTITLTHP